MKNSLTGIPGYEFKLLNLPSDSPESITVSDSSALQNLLSFVAGRDALSLLSRSSVQYFFEQSFTNNDKVNNTGLQQAEIELLQILILVAGAGKPVPTSPRNTARTWRLLKENITGYIRSLNPVQEELNSEQILVSRIRIQTIYYRNIFSSWDAKEVIPALLKRMDEISNQKLGYKLSELSESLFGIFDLMGERINDYFQEIRSLVTAEQDVENSINKICDRSLVAKRAWRFGRDRFIAVSDLKIAGFQLSEIAWSSTFIFERAELEAKFGISITSRLYECSIKIGSLVEQDLKKIYLDSPIWARPFVLLEDGRLFIPIPNLIISFPFLIIERLIEDEPALLDAYSSARTTYLENTVELVIKSAMPSARVFTGVTWKDPKTNVTWEHDVVAVLGNQIFIFEAKSGKLKPASRRGGLDSLKTNFRNIFLDPGRQASRLEELLHHETAGSTLLRDRSGKTISLDFSHPYVIHKFAVCLEHFPGLTTSRQYFEELGLLEEKRHWAPIISLSELLMISAFLDTEVSFFHYLTRRSTIESIASFMADEQDLLSMYLINGFCIDAKDAEGKQIFLRDSDALVRQKKEPRLDKTTFQTPGVYLPPPWNLISKQIYQSNDRCKFAMLEVIMNQAPPSLSGLAERLRNWKRGFSTKEDISFCKYEIGNRTFVVGIHLLSDDSFGGQVPLDYCRDVGKSIAELSNGTDCVIVYKVRKSKTLTYDGISFFRFQKRA